MRQLLPVLGWLTDYNRSLFSADVIAALVVTIMLIPQSLAYAMLAGVPPEMGLYASILPLIAYAFFGSSRTMSVGPVAIISLMTATVVGEVAKGVGVDALQVTVALTLLSGLILLAMGFLRLGFLANLLSHPVVAGFVTASSIVIIISQLKYILGVKAHGDNALAVLQSTLANLNQTNTTTLITGGCVLAFLFWARGNLAAVFEKVGIDKLVATRLARGGPVLAVIITIIASYVFAMGDMGVAIVGHIPGGLPPIAVPTLNPGLWKELLVPALLISVIGYVESMSISKTLAAKRRQRIDTNQELVGLGAANMASAFSGGIPVTGGFSRSAVNFDAGAQTQMAGILTAAGIALAALFITPLLAYLPKVTLAATIIVAIFSLMNFGIIAQAWRYSKSDFTAVCATILVTLILGVELGLVVGVASSVLLHLYKTSRPHIAIVGKVPGTEHFRNINRHEVITCPYIVTLRVDESLYFVNAGYVEDRIYAILAENEKVQHIVLMCAAVNEIDLSALEAMEAINTRLCELGVKFHLSEVKGPVMDCLKKTQFLDRLSGNVYLSQHQAILDLDAQKSPLSTTQKGLPDQD